LQVQQLQEELESLFSQNNALKTQLNDSQSKQKDADENTSLQISKNEPLADLQAENEIALLQIQQLQEELEFYFIKYQSLIVNPVINNVIPINFADKRFEKSLSLARLLNT
jgi:predicted  nucleic acid-binding Zn-ribbon protein